MCCFSSTAWSAGWFICFRFHFPVIDLLMMSYLSVVLSWGGLRLARSQERCSVPFLASKTQPPSRGFFITAPEIRDFNHLVTEITSMGLQTLWPICLQCTEVNCFSWLRNGPFLFHCFFAPWAVCVLSVDPRKLVNGSGQLREYTGTCHGAVNIWSCLESWCGF